MQATDGGPDDWSEADVAMCMAAPHGLTLAGLEQYGLPKPDRITNGARYWTADTMIAFNAVFSTAWALAHPNEHAANVAEIERFIRQRGNDTPA